MATNISLTNKIDTIYGHVFLFLSQVSVKLISCLHFVLYMRKILTHQGTKLLWACFYISYLGFSFIYFLSPPNIKGRVLRLKLGEHQ